jgi:hypothetical protein
MPVGSGEGVFGAPSANLRGILGAGGCRSSEAPLRSRMTLQLRWNYLGTLDFGASGADAPGYSHAAKDSCVGSNVFQSVLGFGRGGSPREG